MLQSSAAKPQANAIAQDFRTAAANYQTYVSALGLAEMAYANDNAARFLTEIQNIDLADLTAANGAADANEALATSLANDETTFEQTDASAGLGYQDAVALAKHNYQQAVALADHNLTVTGDTGAFSTAMATAANNEVAAFTQAYSNFAALEGPALSLDGTDNANAEELAR